MNEKYDKFVYLIYDEDIDELVDLRVAGVFSLEDSGKQVGVYKLVGFKRVVCELRDAGKPYDDERLQYYPERLEKGQCECCGNGGDGSD